MAGLGLNVEVERGYIWEKGFFQLSPVVDSLAVAVADGEIVLAQEELLWRGEIGRGQSHDRRRRDPLADGPRLLDRVAIVQHVGVQQGLVHEDLLETGLGPNHDVTAAAILEADGVVFRRVLVPERCRAETREEMWVDQPGRLDGAVTELGIFGHQGIGQNRAERVSDVDDLCEFPSSVDAGGKMRIRGFD